MGARGEPLGCTFPYFFVGTFIEAAQDPDNWVWGLPISLLFRRDFH